MATASNRTQREVIDFPPNLPVTVALSSTTRAGKSSARTATE